MFAVAFFGRLDSAAGATFAFGGDAVEELLGDAIASGAVDSG